MLGLMDGAEPDVRREYQERLDIEIGAPLDAGKRIEWEREQGRRSASAVAQAQRQEGWLEDHTLELPGGGVYGD